MNITLLLSSLDQRAHIPIFQMLKCRLLLTTRTSRRNIKPTVIPVRETRARVLPDEESQSRNSTYSIDSYQECRQVAFTDFPSHAENNHIGRTQLVHEYHPATFQTTPFICNRRFLEISLIIFCRSQPSITPSALPRSASPVRGPRRSKQGASFQVTRLNTCMRSIRVQECPPRHLTNHDRRKQ